MRSLLLLLALGAVSAFAQPRLDAGRDPLTGEPIVFGTDAEAPGGAAPGGFAGGLELAQHVGAGTSKLVRFVPLSADTEVVVYQDGIDLVVGSLARPLVDAGPLNPPVLLESSRYRLPAQPSDAVVVGNRLYVALRKNEGILMLDVSPTGTLSLVGQISGPDALAVAVAGTTVYVGRGAAGVTAYDVSLPAVPVQLGSVDTPGSANGLALQGTLLAVADGNVGSGPDVRLYDVSVPGTFSPLGTAEMDGFATYAAFHAGRLYVTGAVGLRAFDVSNPSAPVALGTSPAGGDTTYEVVFNGSTAYVAGLAGLRVVDVSAPAPVEVGAYDPDGQGLSVAFSSRIGAVAPLADRFRGLRLVEVDAPAAPVSRTLVPNGGFTYRAVFADDYLYVTNLGGGLRILDGTSPTLADVARVDLPPNTQEVLVRGTRAYVTDSDGPTTGLSILDVTNPAAPVLLGTFATEAGFGMDTDAAGTTLFVAAGFAGLRSYDVSGDTPVLLDTFPLGANAVDVAVDNDAGVAYVVTFGGGMASVYVADPSDITPLDSEPAWGFLQALVIDPSLINGNRVHVADGQSGLRIVDATNAAALVTVSTHPTASPARDVAARDVAGLDPLYTNVYVAEDFAGMRRFEVSANGNAVTVTGTFISADRGIGVAVEPGPSDIDVVRRVALMGGEVGIYVFNDGMPTAAEDGPDAGRLAIEAIGPNPASTAATLRYRLGEAGAATVEVLDLLGRRVTVSTDLASVAGMHTATVDVSALAAGLYVIRVTQGGTQATARLSITR